MNQASEQAALHWHSPVSALFGLLAKGAIYFTALLAVFLLPSLVSAQAANTHKGQETVRSHGVINLKPGAAITFEIHFKNTGTAAWKNSGANFVAVATVDPEKRDSVFEHKFWDASFRPAYLKEAIVRPGEIGTFRFPLQAPDKTGSYEETFQAVAKNLAWIGGTKFTIPINVVETIELPAPIPQTEVQTNNGFAIAVDYPVQDASYSAQWVQGQKLSLAAEPGQQILQTIEVKNTGTATWKNAGTRFVSFYTVRPNYHASPFHSNGPGWMSKSQIRLASDTVKPGETGTMVVLLQAPSAPGTHKDRLRLAAENHTWMQGGELEIEIQVNGPAEQESETPGETGAQQSNLYRDQSYEAMMLISSHRNLTLAPGQTITFQVGFKNVGAKAWKKSGNRFISMYTISPNYRASRFATRTAAVNPGWITPSQIAMSEETVEPGQIGYFRFDLTAPSTPGSYTEQFRLAAEDHSWIKGGEFTLPITVLQSGSLPVIDQPSTGPTDLGPIMRVGLFASDQPLSITADSPFQVRSGSGQVLAEVPARTEVQLAYNRSNGMYELHYAAAHLTTSDYLVAHALDNQTIMEILSYERRLPWNPAVNENLFRGSIEIRYSQATNQVWAINILPMEHYLRGIAETSSESPVEFLKVMTVAARTYATYHYERQTKHADKYFYVDSEYDQVYRGYALEKRHPSLVQAVNLTTGQVVTWTDPQTGETKIAITPYFSNSDGRTRDWSEVWGGEVPWAKSVPVPQDIGKTLLGHGVGMSARGGLLMVVNDGKTYDQVLHYFFQGIQIQDRY